MSLDLLFQAPAVIQIHAACATLALLVGAVQLFRKKGDTLHRITGYTWVTLMATVALSSFFIWTIRMWWLFSPIHLISIFVLVMLWRGVMRARHHDVEGHKMTMKMTYLLGLVVTGLLTFIPGRTMNQVAFGPEGATATKWAALAIVVAVVAGAAWGVTRWRKTPGGIAFVRTH